MINESLFYRHIAWCRQRNLRPSYIAARGRIINTLEVEVSVPLELASEDDLATWFTSLTERVRPATRASYLSHASAFYGWLVRERIREDNPAARLSRPRLQRLLPRPIADDDLRKAVQDAPDRVRPWLLLAALMGLRACEIASLRAEHVNLGLGALVVFEGKGGKQRIIPLHPVVRDELVRLPHSGWLFPHWDQPGPAKPHNISHGCGRYLHSIGIASTLHQFRHHFGTSVYRESRDLRLTQELMGHASPETTAGYAAWSTERASAVVEALAIPQLCEVT